MPGGGDSLGEANDARHLSAMNINASSADQQNDSKSTTGRGKQKPAEPGTMNLTTLRRGVAVVISEDIVSHHSPLNVQSAGSPLNQDRAARNIAQLNAEVRGNGEQEKSSITRTPKSTAAEYAGEPSNLPGDMPIAQINAPESLKQPDRNDTENSEPLTFWEASKQILLETFAVLKPGAPCVWILKAFVRDHAIVDFPGDWQRLCESVGFETFAIARAWQVEHNGKQHAIDGNDKELKVSRKGFFRRLHESKFPELAIDYETVLFVRKPQ